MGNQIYCPNCGNLDIAKYRNNKPVADFFCSSCNEDYELKSKKDKMGKKIVDGAYNTMVERLRESHTPNLFLLNYDLPTWQVVDFLVIPKHFFVEDIIEKRKALAQTAHRSGWVGCNILLQNIPLTGKIFIIKNKTVELKDKVRAEWKKTLFLREEKDLGAKGWLLDVMLSVERINRKEFSLEDVYRFEDYLSQKHPDNHHVKDKIRQQLQFLRNKGYLEFVGRGRYRLA